ncbi:MAG: DUF2244 domain-containing protein [Alphaproteobacteria bacterium]|nr:DUF2244 domain-containing protein [Alphaproteobacteria bacterium]
MTGSGDLGQGLSAAPEDWILDEPLSPPVASTAAGRGRLLALVAGLGLIVGLVFDRLGAGPVAPFLGGSIILFGFALWFNARPSRRYQRLRVSQGEVQVTLEGAGEGAGLERVVWTSPTYFTRAELQDEGYGAARLWLRLSDRRIEIAKALGRPARLALASRLEAALARARKGGS